MAQLHIGLTDGSFGNSETNFFYYLAGLKCGGEQLYKKLVCFDDAFAFCAHGDDLSVECDDGGWPIGCGIGMGEASADSPFVAHLHVSEMAGGFRQQRTETAQQIRALDLEMRGGCADADLSAFFANVGKVLDAADVDEDRGLHQAQLHRREQAVSTGQQLGIIFMPGQERDGFVEAFCGNVIEVGWKHKSSYAAPARFWLRMRQTFSGLMGISRWRMPKGASA